MRQRRTRPAEDRDCLLINRLPMRRQARGHHPSLSWLLDEPARQMAMSADTHVGSVERHSIALAVLRSTSTLTPAQSVRLSFLAVTRIGIHSASAAFECPFPGCGRRFNVNSNMRRHLRNHTSPARPINTASPYTYPLTTVPRSLYPFSSSSNCGPPMHPPAAHISQYRSSDTGSDDDELSESDRWEQERELTKGVDRLRLRAYSASSTVSSPRMQPAVVPRRPRANSCAVPGCRGCRDCASAARPTVLHPSGEVYRSRPGR